MIFDQIEELFESEEENLVVGCVFRSKGEICLLLWSEKKNFHHNNAFEAVIRLAVCMAALIRNCNRDSS